MKRGHLNFILSLVLFFIVLVSTACYANKPADSSSSIVQHIVLCWLNDPGDAQAITEITEHSYSFDEIPGVISVEVGKALPSDRPVVDDSFDLAIIITLESPSALKSYLANPIHRDAAESYLKPHISRLVIYDVSLFP